MTSKRSYKCIRVFSIAVVVWMVVTLVHASSFSVLVADDFSHGNGVGAFHVSFVDYLKASLEYSKKEYLGWQGTYFSMFIQALLSPINNWGFRQLRLIMGFSTMFFLCSLLLFVYILFDRLIGKSLCIKELILMIAVFAFCAYDSYPEIYFWYSGATSYSIPFSFLLIALAMIIKNCDAPKKLYAVVGALCGIAAMGGSLAVAGTGCYVAVLICIHAYLEHKRIPLSSTVITILWIICAGINAIAPGNFVRHSVIDQSGVHPIDAFFDATKMASYRWNFIFSGTNFAFLTMIVFFCGMTIGERIQRSNNTEIAVGALGLFTSIVTAFPVALGYSAGSIPNRCAFLIDADIIISSLYFAFVTGRWVLSLFDNDQIKVIKFIVVIIAIGFFMLDGFCYSDIKIIQISEQLSDGIYDEHYYECKEFMNKLYEYEKGEDVRISRNEFPEAIENTYNFYLYEDPDNWINKSVAEYYGFNSISIYSE